MPWQFQVFDLYVLKGLPVREVARVLCLSVANVYVTKHRIGKMLRQEVRRLESELP